MAIKFNHTGAGDIVLSSDAAATLRVDGHKVWHENNDGTGSLLDADRLDGAEGSAYAKLASNETVTGNWTVSGNWGFTMDTIGDFMFWRNGTTGAAGVGFRNDDGVKGYIGFDDAETFNIYNAATSSKLTVDNAGNLIADGDITGLTVASITAANLLDKSATESVSGAWTFTNTTPTAFEKGIRLNTGVAITSDADLITPVGSQGIVRTYVSTTGATNLPTAAGVWLQVDRVVAGSGSANGAFRLFQASSATPDLRYAVWNDTGATWVWDTVALASDLSGYLPLTGGALTGALSSTGIFTSTAVASLAAPNFLASNSGPAFGWYETDAAVDEKAWDIAASAGALRLRLVNDALNVATNIMTVDRTGTTIDSVTFAPAVYFSGGAAGTPSLAFSSEPTTGIYRSAAGAIAVSVLGTNELTINQTKAIFAGAVDVGGNVLPTTTGTYAVGSAANRWSYGYAGAWYATDTADTVYMNHTGLYSDRASTYFRNTNASGINYYEADTAHYFRDYNAGAATNQFVITSAQITAYTHLRPDTTNVHALGGASAQWSAIYGTTLYENGTSLASKYAQLGVAGAAELSAAVVDFDASTDPGWYRLSNTGSTNGPGTSVYYYIQNVGYVGGTTLHNRLQIAWPYRVGTDGFYLRSRYNDVWTGWKQVAYLDAVLNLTGGTVTGDIIRSGVGSNSDPGADNLRIGGYGIMGNRSALYITNANATGEVRIGNNGVHAVTNLATFSTSGLSISAGLTMVGTIDGLLGQGITDFGSTSVGVQKEIGFFSAGFQATGYPTGQIASANYWSGIEFKHNLGTDYRTQIAFGTGAQAISVRYNINGTWGSWYDIFTSGKDVNPSADSTYTSGAAAKRWLGVYADGLNANVAANPGIDTYRVADFWQSYITTTDVGTYPVPYLAVWNMGSAYNGTSPYGALQFATQYGTDNNGFYIRRGCDSAGGEAGAAGWQYWKQILTKEYADTLYPSAALYLPLAAGTGSPLTGDLYVTSVSPRIYMTETDQAADATIWAVRVNGAAMDFAAFNDAKTVARSGISIARSGNAISSVTYGNATDLPSHTFHGSMTVSSTITEGGTLLSAKYTGINTTMLGKTGNVSYDAVTDTAAEWGALPVGYSRMMANTIGIAGGAPLDSNFGYFTKVANRDSSGGWAGMWVGYSAGQNYLGRAATNAVFATWEKLWSDANDGASSGLDADLLDGQHGSYYAPLAGPAFTGSGSISAAGSHLSLYETDAADALDRGLIEVNSNALLLYGYDNSAATWRQFFSGNITTGVVTMPNLTVTGAITEGGTALSSKYAAISLATNAVQGVGAHGSRTASATFNAYEDPMWKSGFWEVNSAAWTPTTAWYWGLTTAHTSNSGSYNYSGQIIIGNGLESLYFRSINNGTAGNWCKVWHDRNDGASSGLDADLLDGQHGSYYAPLASPTFTGTLTAPAIVATSSVSGVTLGVAQTAGNNGYGLSLYNGPVAGTPTYGIMFQTTATYGTHGAVTGDWATYFTMNNSSGRGWIFRDVSSPSNCASITNAGVATFSGTATANGYELGWRRVVQITGAGRTLVVGDAGKSIHSSSTITVNSGIFTAGDVITITNSTSAAITISQGTSVTLYLAGTATTGSRTLAGYGIANIVCVASNTFYVSGAGVT